MLSASIVPDILVHLSVSACAEPNAIARGGRYDKVGQAFGRDRPATG
ncbi:MAG: ATP phosphoribosyltransferase regulatory subunit, partial [Microbacterium sp.]|nr:ATP phosphoribosyltransferase regulatory subunit [Microbacterium sp.]